MGFKALIPQVNISFSFIHSDLGLSVKADAQKTPHGCSLIFKKTWGKKQYWDLYLAESGVAGILGPMLSVISVFQHPVTVDRWIIIFLLQNN